MTNWKDWYFERAKQRASQEARDLFWKVITPCSSVKVLTQITQGVLDIPDPTVVDWRFFRPSHVYLRQEALDKRTISAAMNNIRKIAGYGAQRRLNPWFMKQMGWGRPYDRLKEISIITEDEYGLIEDSAVQGLPTDLALGVRVMLKLMYYGGLSANQTRHMRLNDIIHVDGRTLIYVSGKLLDLPDHVRLPLIAWIRIKTDPRRPGRKPVHKTKVFRIDQARIVAKFPRLSDTYRSLKRLRG